MMLGDATSDIAAVYQSELGRSPDPAGLAFYVSQLQSGVPLANIQAAINASPEHTAEVAATLQTQVANVASAAPNPVNVTAATPSNAVAPAAQSSLAWNNPTPLDTNGDALWTDPKWQNIKTVGTPQQVVAYLNANPELVASTVGDPGALGLTSQQAALYAAAKYTGNLSILSNPTIAGGSSSDAAALQSKQALDTSNMAAQEAAASKMDPLFAVTIGAMVGAAFAPGLLASNAATTTAAADVGTIPAEAYGTYVSPFAADTALPASLPTALPAATTDALTAQQSQDLATAWESADAQTAVQNTALSAANGDTAAAQALTDALGPDAAKAAITDASGILSSVDATTASSLLPDASTLAKGIGLLSSLTGLARSLTGQQAARTGINPATGLPYNVRPIQAATTLPSTGILWLLAGGIALAVVGKRR